MGIDCTLSENVYLDPQTCVFMNVRVSLLTRDVPPESTPFLSFLYFSDCTVGVKQGVKTPTFHLAQVTITYLVPL